MKLTNAKSRKKLALINVTKSSAVTQDNDLARWCAALTAEIITDEVPPGWLTAAQLCKKLNKAPSTISHRLLQAVRSGKTERQNFRVLTGDFVRNVPHYKLK